MPDDTVETIAVDDNTRIRIVYDPHPTNPLTDWNHGCSLLTFGSRNRIAFDIDDSPSPKGFMLHSIHDYREFEEASYTGFEHRQYPSLLTTFRRECAAWGTITEAYEGYTFGLWDTDWDRIDGFMWITKESYRHLNMLGYGQAGPAMTKPAITARHKQRAGELLTGTFQAFNDWCTGEVYGAIVEKCVTWTTDEDDFDDKQEWEEIDACWGFYINHDDPYHKQFDFIVHDMGYATARAA